MTKKHKPRKVLFVQHGASIMGGVERLLLRITHSYRQRGIESIVVLPEEGELLDRLQAIGIETRLVPSNLFPGSNSHGLNQYLSCTYKRAKALVEIINQENIDIIHTNTVYPFDGALAAAQTGIPHVWHVHSNFDMDTIPSLLLAYPLSSQSARALYAKLADALVGCSKRTLRFFEEGGDCPLRVIQNGLDIEEFDKKSAPESTDIRALLGVDLETPLVAFVGRISQQKDPLTFVKAAFEILEKHPSTHFVILGPTDDVQLKLQMDNAINASSYSKYFHVLGEREDIPTLLPQFNLLLLTSKFEGLAGICLEAMAARCPIVSTRCGGSEEVIINCVSGFLTDIGDYRSIAQNAVAILEDIYLASAMKIEGRKRVEDHFSWEHFIDQFVDLYSELLKDFDPEQKAEPALELCFQLIAKNAELALQLEAHAVRLNELEGFFDRLQSTTVYQIFKTIYHFVGGHIRPKL